MGIFIDRVIERLDRAQAWPNGRFKKVGDQLGVWISFRESERARLKADANWEDSNREYQIDPLAPKISDAFASLLYGRRPKLTAAKKGDQKRLDEIAKENGFPANLQRAVRTSSSEGEVWWRVKVDEDLADVPLIEWYSRTAVYPLWVGPRLAACAFVSRYDMEDLNERPDAIVYRHFEIHERGAVANVLYEGSKATLGRRVELTAFEETADLADEWEHELPAMLAGRIPSTEGVDPTLGVSDYFRIKDMLHDLNEALTIGAENARMTLKQRMIAPASAFDQEGNLRDQEVWSADSLDSELPGEEGAGAPFRVLEYTFPAQQILEWRRGLAEDALGRIGIVAQFVGAGSTNEGLAVSGTALRVRLIPTTAAGEERGQFWDDKRDGLPGILAVCQMLDALPVDEGGLGISWQDAETPPSVERGSTLPEDETELVDRNAAAVTGQIRSRRVAIEEQHPDWTPQQVSEEEARIKQDIKDSAPASSAFGGFLAADESAEERAKKQAEEAEERDEEEGKGSGEG
jgi:hypothetical protein